MPEDDFEEASRLYATGQMSRRRFIGRLVAGGVSATAAIALVNATGPAAFASTFRGRAGHYGRVPGRYGRAPGRYGNAPGHYGKAPRRRDDFDRDQARRGKQSRSWGRRR